MMFNNKIEKVFVVNWFHFNLIIANICICWTNAEFAYILQLFYRFKWKECLPCDHDLLWVTLLFFCVLGSSTIFLSNYLSVYAPLMNVMHDFISMDSVDLQGGKPKNRKWKILAHSGTQNSQPWDLSQSLYPLSYPCLMKALLLKWPLYIHVLPLHWYKFEARWSRAYFVLYIYCNVLHIGIIISILDIKQKDADVLCLLSTCKTRPNTLPDLVPVIV